MPLHFSADEMAARRANVAKALGAAGLDGLLVFKQESMYYLTGYDTFGFSLFQCLIVDADGHCNLLTRLPDLRQARYTSDLSDAQIHIWRDRAGMDPAGELVTLLGTLGMQGKRLGIELDSYGLKAAAWRELEPRLSAFCAWTDASTVVDRIRSVKSDQEIAYARRAAELSDDGWDAACRLGTAGAFEGDILAAMQGAVFHGGGDYAGNEFIIGSGPSALLVRYHAGRRHLDINDQLTLEWSGAYRRYHAAMMRTLLVGQADAHQRAMFDACLAALTACMETLRPGVTMGQVFDAHARVFDAAGFADHRMAACGYGMSAIYNPLWVDPPMFYTGNPLVVAERNIFFLHMILADSDSGRAMTLGQSVLVTADGCESLSRSSLELVVN
ncbi:MAG: Xaa-Pro peptidase family protein [Pseudomonadota bacterium]